MDNLTTIKQDLYQIAQMLMLNGTLTECSGIVRGKLGISIFFFHYAQFTGNMLYADYAMDLIDETLSQLHVNSSADYERGLAGIGVGIDYLIQNDFLKVEDDVCEEFDDRMYRAVMYDPWHDFSQYEGLTGYGRYWITRLRYQSPSVQARECLLRIASFANISEVLLYYRRSPTQVTERYFDVMYQTCHMIQMDYAEQVMKLIVEENSRFEEFFNQLISLTNDEIISTKVLFNTVYHTYIHFLKTEN